MEAIVRCRVLLTVPTSPVPRRRILYRAGLNFTRWRKPKIVELDDMDELGVLWLKYCALKVAEINFKKELIGELKSECQIDGVNDEGKNISILHSKIGTLKEKNVALSFKSIVDQLLSCVETFPFDSRQILMYKDENQLSIRQIRNEIERQYLAWKYKVDVLYIKEIIKRFGLGLYDYRSLKNMQRNVEQLEDFSGVYQLSIADKIYFINQIPFSLNNIKRFKNICIDFKMKLFLPENNKIFQNSHHQILLTLSTLKLMNFTLKQIEEALPFLYFSFPTVLQRLYGLMTNPEIMKYRKEDKFLAVLYYPVTVLKKEVLVPKDRFEQLVEIAFRKPEEQALKRSNAAKIMFLVNKFFTVKYSCTPGLKKFSKYLHVPEKQLIDTLDFLKGLGICDEEMEESLTIIFYSRDDISRVLEKIESNTEVLTKYGYKRGSLDKETDLFKKGTRQKRKILQLCLYYLEKESDFSRGEMLQN